MNCKKVFLTTENYNAFHLLELIKVGIYQLYFNLHTNISILLIVNSILLPNSQKFLTYKFNNSYIFQYTYNITQYNINIVYFL